MKIDVFLTPANLQAESLRDRAVVVFDVLRATTTMTAGLAVGVREFRIFESLEAAQSAAKKDGGVILAGERNTLPPPGFDLGNSPGQYNRAAHAGKIVYMATTNGTRAIVAGRSARLLLIGALVNASAVAQCLIDSGLDVTLLCSGSDGAPSMEDLLGAGAVIDALDKKTEVDLQNDLPRIAQKFFVSVREQLRAVISDSTGGRHIRRVHLDADIDFAAKLDSLSVVGVVRDQPLRVEAFPMAPVANPRQITASASTA